MNGMHRMGTAAVVAAALAAPAGVTAQTTSGEEAMKDIVTTAVEAGTFRTLAAALEAAGLVETLRGAGPFTVFAPTDEAFAKLPEGVLEMLLKDTRKLAAILTYHVVPGRVLAAEAMKMDVAPTVNGSTLTLRLEGGAVYVDDARVVATDILASNGVIHVIDRVVLPEPAPAGGR